MHPLAFRRGLNYPRFLYVRKNLSRGGAHGGMDASLMARMKELEDENRRLKKMYAEERLKAEIVAEALTKKW